jgi:hypothetical protein
MSTEIVEATPANILNDPEARQRFTTALLAKLRTTPLIEASDEYTSGIPHRMRLLYTGDHEETTYVTMILDVGPNSGRRAPLYELRPRGRQLLEECMTLIVKPLPADFAYTYGRDGFLGVIRAEDVWDVLAIFSVLFTVQECVAVLGHANEIGIQHGRRPSQGTAPESREPEEA